jgi:ATP synthase F1 gamma subunit
MQAIPEIKKDIEFNRNLRSLVEVLKSIAVAHYHTLEKKIRVEGEFYATLKEFFAMEALRRVPHPFLTQSPRPAGVVAITTDMGLLGGLNMKVMNAALDEVYRQQGRLFVIGEKGHGIARDRGFSFVSFPGVVDESRFSQAMSLRDFLIDQALGGKIGSLAIFYPEPVSFMVQRVKRLTVLPFAIPWTQEDEAAVQNRSKEPVIVESRPAQMIEYLIYLWVGQLIHEILGFSRLSELSARYIHLENSSQKLQEVEKNLRLKYFRVRHEIIDKGMREIFSARSIYVGDV